MALGILAVLTVNLVLSARLGEVHVQLQHRVDFLNVQAEGRAGARQYARLAGGVMTALDIFVILLLGGAAMVGFVRGFTHEVLSLLAWVAGIAALKLFHTPVSERLVDTVGTETAASVLAFALLFLPAYIAVKLFARAIGGKARRSVLGPVDRLLGGGFGILKGLIGATMFFLIANLATDMVYGGEADRPGWMTESRTYPLLNATGRAVVDWVELRRHEGNKD